MASSRGRQRQDLGQIVGMERVHALAQGRIPLWNPYQLNGIPFLAVPHSRIFYPPNWVYLWPRTTAIRWTTPGLAFMAVLQFVTEM